MNIRRLVDFLSNPFVILALILVTVTGVVSTRIYWSFQHTQMLMEEFVSAEFDFETEIPDWIDKLPEPVAERCAPYFEEITVVRTGHVDDHMFDLLGSCNTIRDLNLGIYGFFKITDDRMQFFENLTQLESLVMFADDVTDGGCVYLAGCVNMERLWLFCPEITDDCLTHFSNMHKLKNLALDYSQIQGHGFRVLQNNCDDLQQLALRGSQLDDSGMAKLGSFPDLQMLDLAYTPISNHGLRHLHALSHLTDLDLSGTAITDDGLTHLSGMTAIEELLINESNVSAQAVAQLVQKIGGVEILSMSRTEIGDEEMAILAALPGLKRLELQNTKITEEGINNIRRKFPKLKLITQRVRRRY